jgi:hypothetical protein
MILTAAVHNRVPSWALSAGERGCKNAWMYGAKLASTGASELTARKAPSRAVDGLPAMRTAAHWQMKGPKKGKEEEKRTRGRGMAWEMRKRWKDDRRHVKSFGQRTVFHPEKSAGHTLANEGPKEERSASGERSAIWRVLTDLGKTHYSRFSWPMPYAP